MSDSSAAYRADVPGVVSPDEIPGVERSVDPTARTGRRIPRRDPSSPMPAVPPGWLRGRGSKEMARHLAGEELTPLILPEDLAPELAREREVSGALRAALVQHIADAVNEFLPDGLPDDWIPADVSIALKCVRTSVGHAEQRLMRAGAFR